MKKIIIASLIILAGCSSSNHNTRHGVQPNIELKNNIDSTVTVGQRVNGSAQCSEILFIKSSPNRQTYGSNLQPTGVNADAACIAGAVHDAMSKSNSDILIAPTFTVVRDSFGCLPFMGCLYSNTQVLVNGHSGRLTPKQ